MQENIIGWIFNNKDGIIAGIMTTFLIQLPFFIRNILFNIIRKPTPKIIVREIGEGELNIIFRLDKKRKSRVDFLAFKIDIPGKYISNDIEKNLVEKAIIDNDFLTKHSKIVTSETIRIQLINMQPESWCNIKVYYQPTYGTSARGNVPKPAFLDLHNISKVRYNWTYLGKVKADIFYYNFSSLKYIKEDNNRLHSSQLYHSMDEINKINEKRKDW